METIHLKNTDIEINYELVGNGQKTLVFVHGNSSCKEAFAAQMAKFAAGEYSVLAFDLPGHGSSANATNPEKTYNMPSYAQLCAELIKALGIKEHIIVGWSLGGNSALEMAGNDNVAPDNDLKGIFIFGAPPVGPGPENLQDAYLPATFASAVGEAEASDEQIKQYVQMVYGTLDPMPQVLIDAAKRADGLARMYMVQHWIGGVSGHKQIDTIANWEKPIAVLHGVQDPFVSLPYLKSAPWKNLWRGQVFEMDCGHAPFAEMPDDFNAYLADFAKDVF